MVLEWCNAAIAEMRKIHNVIVLIQACVTEINKINYFVCQFAGTIWYSVFTYNYYVLIFWKDCDDDH